MPKRVKKYNLTVCENWDNLAEKIETVKKITMWLLSLENIITLKWDWIDLTSRKKTE